MTNLLYLHDSYLFQATATIKELKILEDGRQALILDKTIFYPQGGGQPFDIGTISSSDSLFEVTDVRLDKEGVVFHIGKLQQGSLVPGTIVTLTIDQGRRIFNSKLHSAGHLIDCAVIELTLPLKPSKGFHFPDGPYVEYFGELPNTPEVIKALQEKIDKLIAQNIPIRCCELSAIEAAAQGIEAPAGKSARIVHFEGFDVCGCGGTHVHTAGEVGKLMIRKIKTKGDTVRISYEIQ